MICNREETGSLLQIMDPCDATNHGQVYYLEKVNLHVCKRIKKWGGEQQRPPNSEINSASKFRHEH